ncbi:MAG TPA: CoA ester lyase [Advenella sp.]|nr:CoA ester lyase [Advenella sp.]
MKMRSALFVPATRVDRIPKALASGADIVIVDLEDAVEQDAKQSARDALQAFAVANPGQQFLLRVNDARSRWFNDDIAMCAKLTNIAGVMLPKAESESQIKAAGMAGKPVYPIIESAMGIMRMPELCQAPGVARLSFGALDLALDLNMDRDSEGAQQLLAAVRPQLVIQSRAAGIDAPLDGVFPDIADTDGLRQSVALAKGMGFAGALCIHPAQLAVIHAVFEPTAQEKDWARRVLDEHEKSGRAAFKLDGQMVDMPVIEKARRILQFHP